MANRAALLYRSLTHSRWFTRIVVAGCMGYALLYTLGSTLFALALLRGTATMARVPTLETDVIVVILSALGTGLLLVVGVLALPRSRLAAYLWFKRGVLVSILVGQPFLFYQQQFGFYQQQFGALGELALNLVVLSTLNYMIHCEQHAMGNRIPPEQGQMHDQKAAQAVQTPDHTSRAVPLTARAPERVWPGSDAADHAPVVDQGHAASRQEHAPRQETEFDAAEHWSC